jgi:aminopeptidase N
MNKTTFSALAFLAFAFNTFAQFPENTFQSAQNQYYWKNRKPYEGYWQQDVHYKINASIDDKTDIIDANEELVYTNNSPDALSFVFFHLYSNAQAKGSYLADLYKNNGMKLRFGKYQEQGLGTNVSKITVNGAELKTELDNTVLKVYLPTPLAPGQSITFNIDFKTYFDSGTIRNRMKLFNAWGYKHYDVVHWYPRISVYDRKFGWDTDQHMDHEFYGDFGTFDVAFTIPNHYILDATGVLLNRDEVLPEDLRSKLDLKNFKNKPWNEKPSVIVAPDGTTKTWKFHAENVHDFALTADPTYRIGEAEWNGIKCISLVQEPHAAHWQNAAEYAAKVIKVNSEDIGMYAYPKMVVADAQDGMEYPMLTLDGGFDPDYRDLLAHEIGHNWFFGMVGNNETYKPAMDEGFTQFLTNWTYERIDGKQRIKYLPKSGYVRRFTEPDFVRNSEVYNGYMNEAARDVETFMSFHGDMYNGALRHGGGYRQVYMKTATMLYNLQYTMGDSLFLASMQHYFHQWKFAHPYLEDFRNSIIQYSHVDLNWFFDQWMETSKTIDYSVHRVKKGDEKGSYEITFKRNGMQMPIDFTVISKRDSIYNYHIPNTWFVKKTRAQVLPRWIGWDKVKPKYTAKVYIPGGIANVIIDSSTRLADVNMLNNNQKFPIKYRFDSKIYNPSDWTRYELFARPDVWYNGYDGLKVGLNLNGNYMMHKHIFDATVWFNTGIGQNYLDSITKSTAKDLYDNVSFRFSYRTATEKFMKGSAFYFSAKALDGLNAYTVGFDRKDSKGKNKVYMYFKSMYRKGLNDLPYLLLPTEWQVNKLNNSINLGIEHTYSYSKGTGNINLGMRSSAVMSDYDYHYLNLTVINRTRLWRTLLSTRLVAQYGTGKNWASESSLFLAGANPEEMMDNKFTRSQGFFDPSWAAIGKETNYFHHGGGLNLRGYSGYLAPQKLDDGSLAFTYKGQSGAALNAELDLAGIIKMKQNWLSRTFNLSTYLFGDAGIINYSKPDESILKMSDLRVDAGVGVALTIKKFGVLQTVDPLTIRFDMPVFLNKIPATDEGYLQYRFVVGVSRAF